MIPREPLEPLHFLYRLGPEQVAPVRPAWLATLVGPDEHVVAEPRHVVECKLSRAHARVLPHLVGRRAAGLRPAQHLIRRPVPDEHPAPIRAPPPDPGGPALAEPPVRLRHRRLESI